MKSTYPKIIKCELENTKKNITDFNRFLEKATSSRNSLRKNSNVNIRSKSSINYRK